MQGQKKSSNDASSHPPLGPYFFNTSAGIHNREVVTDELHSLPSLIMLEGGRRQ